jgi:tyrosyl-tRNA synthetase
MVSASSPTPRTDVPLEAQLDIIFRGVEYGDEGLARSMRAELRERLQQAIATGRPLTAYVGVDPTGAELTLGHTVPLRKLRQLQDLGHRAVFVIGTFTARIGDPSDKEAARRQLSDDEVQANAATYVEQAMRVLSPDGTEVRYNGEWLAKLGFADLIELASHFTVSQFLQRDNFRNRFAAGEPIWLHEFFYALMQAYDAYELSTDIQIGGTEQLFNLMAGRKLQEARGERPQIPLTMPILVGTDGVARMSKSAGNYVAIAEAPEEQYGKTMSIPDSAMENWFVLASSLAPGEIGSLLGDVEAGRVHPMAAKKILAADIVNLFHGQEASDRAAERFERTVQEAGVPDQIPAFAVETEMGLLELLTRAGLASSNSEARRLVEQGGVRLDGTALRDPAMTIGPGHDRTLQVGRRRFVRLTGP